MIEYGGESGGEKKNKRKENLKCDRTSFNVSMRTNCLQPFRINSFSSHGYDQPSSAQSYSVRRLGVISIIFCVFSGLRINFSLRAHTFRRDTPFSIKLLSHKSPFNWKKFLRIASLAPHTYCITWPLKGCARKMRPGDWRVLLN